MEATGLLVKNEVVCQEEGTWGFSALLGSRLPSSSGDQGWAGSGPIRL